MASSKDNRKLTTEELDEYIALQKELKELKAQQGEKEHEGRVSHAVSSFFERRETKEKRLVSKKKYIILALLTGWMGGHRFYARQWVTAVLYLVFFWSGFPLAMTLIDLLVVIPMQADEDGNILM